MAAVTVITLALTTAVLNTTPSPWSKPSCRHHPQGGHHQHHHLATVITVLVTREAQCEGKGPILQLQGMCPGGPCLESDGHSSGRPADQSRGSSTPRRSPWGPRGMVLTGAAPSEGGAWRPRAGCTPGLLRTVAKGQTTQKRMDLYRPEAERRTRQVDPE